MRETHVVNGVGRVTIYSPDELKPFWVIVKKDDKVLYCKSHKELRLSDAARRVVHFADAGWIKQLEPYGDILYRKNLHHDYIVQGTTAIFKL